MAVSNDTIKSGKVLIVEDDKSLRGATGELFNILGYETVMAADGQAALKILEQDQTIDFLFTDVVMPKGINGVELIERAREMRPNIKVLMASGYPFDKIDTHGAVDESSFIIKPYRVAQIAAKMQTLKAHRA